jgi:hypothetical protein
MRLLVSQERLFSMMELVKYQAEATLKYFGEAWVLNRRKTGNSTDEISSNITGYYMTRSTKYRRHRNIESSKYQTLSAEVKNIKSTGSNRCTYNEDKMPQ